MVHHHVWFVIEIITKIGECTIYGLSSTSQLQKKMHRVWFIIKLVIVEEDALSVVRY